MLLFIVASLATWRLSSLFVREDGPADIFVKLRHFVGVAYDEHSNPYGKNILAKLLLCVWCFSVWVAFAVALLLYHNHIVEFFFYWLALSASAIIIDEFIARQERMTG